MRLHAPTALFAVASLLLAGTAAAVPGYYRFPAAGADRVVFTAEGDLWSVPLTGGLATRLTTHPAEESHAALSPDGRSIAFTASYSGVAEAWVMPVTGGMPRQVSFEGQRSLVLGWTPAGEVLYAVQSMPGPFWSRNVVAVDPESGKRRVLPLAGANEAAVAADGSVTFTRGGLHLSTDNARRYRGGLMASLWRWTPADAEARPLFEGLAANAREPMLAGDRIYFVSDADGLDNLWSARLDGSDRVQLTRHADFGVRGPSLAAGRIVYQHGADLRVLDLAQGKDQALAIDLVSDFDQARRRWHKKPLEFLTGASVGNDAERVAVLARGRLAIAGVGPLRRVDVTLPGDARVSQVAMAPDGKAVYAITDQSGEQELWRFGTDGSPRGTQLTRDGGAHRWGLHPSPDGKWIAHHDKRGRLFLLELATGTNTLVDENPADFHADLTWSPDSKALAFARSASDRQLNQVFVLDVASRKVHVLTSDRYVSSAPAFSPDGQWLYFLSDRHFDAWPSGPWGDRNMGPGFVRRTRVYALSLQSGRRFPFQAKDELAPAKPAGDDKKDDKKKEGEAALPAIEYAGLAERLHEVPIAPGGYEALAVDAARLYLLDREPGDDARPSLKTLAIADDAPKPETFMADVAAFQLSGNRKKLLILKAGAGGPGDLLVVDAGAKAPAELGKAQVRLKDWQLELDPRQEWRQMFVDAWRMHREFFYDPAMRGVDWNAARARHEPLLARVHSREELNDLLGQMTAEVGSLHSQIVPGELRSAQDGAAFASLGAELEAVDDGYRIARIWQAEVELPGERGPLAAPGVDARVGDVITAINGVPTAERAPYAALLNQAGQQVLLTLKRGAAEHRVVVVPVNGGRHSALAAEEWERANLARVEAASSGRIGYLHLRAMGDSDIEDFARDFYGQFDRDGLVIDVRNNRGGNVDSWIIEKLLRRAWAFWKTPGGPAYWNMQQTFRGHLVVLINEHTYSDGETFAAGVKALGLGRLIGRRTAGAGVWLTGRNNLRDGGRARAAEFPQYDPEGNWLLEGRGVDPDQVVDNLPRASFDGGDAQLEAALAWLREKLEKEPVKPAQAKPIGGLDRPGSDARRQQ